MRLNYNLIEGGGRKSAYTIMKKISLLFLSLLLLVFSTTNVFARENDLKSCSLSNIPIPEKGEVILINDNSSEYTTKGAITVANVDKTYSVRLQNLSGDCTSAATVRITGYYTYDSGNGTVISTELSAQFNNVPLHWFAYLNNQWSTVNGTKIFHSIYYQSYTDYYDCVHSGYWSNGETFEIK